MHELRDNLRQMAQQLRRRQEAGEYISPAELRAVRAISILCYQIALKQLHGCKAIELGRLGGQALLATRLYLAIVANLPRV